MNRLLITISLTLAASSFGLRAEEEVTVSQASLGMFQPITEVATTPDNPITEPKVDLGRMLYYDERLSKNRSISCNSCHDLADYGDDARKTSEGIHEQLGERSAPSVYNAAIHIAQFWDGRAADVEEQAVGPITNPIEMGMPDPDYVLEVLNSIPEYVEAFEKAFPDEKEPLNYENIGRAIGAFERKLMTPSPFDDFLEGDKDALTNAEKHGLNLFISTGCTTCHNGMGVGGHMYQKLGLVKPWPTDDLGRYEVTENEADKYVFKVPSLRNVTETAPYLHDGSVESLEEMTARMAEHQLGRQLSDEDVDAIVTFLGSLEGRIDESFVARPELPEDGPSTPQPES